MFRSGFDRKARGSLQGGVRPQEDEGGEEGEEDGREGEGGQELRRVDAQARRR